MYAPMVLILKVMIEDHLSDDQQLSVLFQEPDDNVWIVSLFVRIWFLIFENKKRIPRILLFWERWYVCMFVHEIERVRHRRTEREVVGVWKRKDT